jgi:putative transposase
VKGRKRFTLCDCAGNWLESVVLPANTGERAGALALFEKVQAAPWSQKITRIWADQGFAGAEFEDIVHKRFRWWLDISSPKPGQKGFCVVFKRWLVEQLFGCWGRYRRLSRDYEQNTDCSRTTLQVASLHRWLRRLKPAPNTDPPFRYRKL